MNGSSMPCASGKAPAAPENDDEGRPWAAFETVKKVVIPSQCAHWRGNPPDDRNIFDSENIGFPKIWGIATPACGLVRDDRSF